LTGRGVSGMVSPPSEVIHVRADHDVLRIGQAAGPEGAIRPEVLVNNCDSLARSSIKVMNFLRTCPRGAVVGQDVLRHRTVTVGEGEQGPFCDAFSQPPIVEYLPQLGSVNPKLGHGVEA
jgi:hypothetical protein